MYSITNRRHRNILLLYSLFLSACSTTNSYFKTPNDVLKMNTLITMQNGTTRSGLLTILFENDLESNTSLISFKPIDGLAEEKLNFSDIKSYSLNSITYVAKYVNLNSNGTYRGLFLKLLSSDSSKIQLYQLEQKYKSNPTGEDRDYYYLSVPSFLNNRVVELQSSALVPSFENKMAAFVSNCPALAEKIRNKEKDYSYGFLTATFKKIEIMKKIIQEYDSCKRK